MGVKMRKEMHKQEKFWKWKLPLYTLLAETATMLLVTVPIIIMLSSSQGITQRLLSDGSAEDGVTGWLVIPALLGDAAIGIALVVLIVLTVLYLAVVCGSLGWSILFHHVNKGNSWLLCAVAEGPALLAAGGTILYAIRGCMKEQSLWPVLVIVPMILLLAEVLLQIRHMWQLHRGMGDSL